MEKSSIQKKIGRWRQVLSFALCENNEEEEKEAHTNTKKKVVKNIEIE